MTFIREETESHIHEFLKDSLLVAVLPKLLNSIFFPFVRLLSPSLAFRSENYPKHMDILTICHNYLEYDYLCSLVKPMFI
jgi:hypothetical protein